MGYNNVIAVLEGLDGKKCEFPWGKPTADGSQRMKVLSGDEMAILLTVAAKQFDDDNPYHDPEPIFYATIERMVNYTHVSRSTFIDSRNFLVKAGLLQYAKKARHMDYKKPSRERDYESVYRIDVRQFQSIDAEVKVREPDSKVRELDSKVRELDSKVREPDSKVRELDSKVREPDTHIHNNITNKQTGSKYLSVVVERIARSLGKDEKTIGQQKVADAIRGKFVDTVYGLIDNPPRWVLAAENKVGALISAIEKLPLAQNDPAWQAKYAPHPEDVLEKLSLETRYLVETALSSTGCKRPSFASNLVQRIDRLLAMKREDAKEFVVEVVNTPRAADRSPDSAALAMIVKLDDFYQRIAGA